MTNLESYAKGNHKQFTHAIILINNRTYIVYKNKGYTDKSTVYGSIYEIRQGEGKTLKFKTKKQVVAFLQKV